MLQPEDGISPGRFGSLLCIDEAWLLALTHEHGSFSEILYLPKLQIRNDGPYYPGDGFSFGIPELTVTIDVPRAQNEIRVTPWQVRHTAGLIASFHFVISLRDAS